LLFLLKAPLCQFVHYGFHDLDGNKLDGTAGKGPGVYDVSVGNRILL